MGPIAFDAYVFDAPLNRRAPQLHADLRIAQPRESQRERRASGDVDPAPAPRSGLDALDDDLLGIAPPRRRECRRR